MEDKQLTTGENVPKTLTIKTEDAIAVYRLLEAMNSFLHQEANFTAEKISEFASSTYPACRELFYETVRDWLPPTIMEQIEEE